MPVMMVTALRMPTLLATQRRVTARKFSKTNERLIPIIKKGLLLGWSPENIRCRMKNEVADIALSHTTVYKRIAANKAHGGSLYKNLPRFGKKRCKGGKRKAGRTMIPKRINISDRPEVVDLRSRLGDWEGDTVYGQNTYLVTLVERKSRLTLIGKVDTKHAEIIANSMIEFLKRVPSVYTITLDNGGEFAANEKRFAKPYSSYQRGTNENTNDIIRRTWPKKMTLGYLTAVDMRAMKVLLNTMPRKALGGRTPIELYTGQHGEKHSLFFKNSEAEVDILIFTVDYAGLTECRSCYVDSTYKESRPCIDKYDE